MPASEVAYLVFDAEAVADGDLVSRIRYPADRLLGFEAIKRYRQELIEQTGRDILPVTFMLPAAIAIAKVGPDFRLIDIVSLDAPKFRPHALARGFWSGWKYYNRPTLVTFNGRGYDMPLLELAAFRYGLANPEWFKANGPSYEQSRNRYNSTSHIDLIDFFSNFGAVRMAGGLNLLATLIGKPGKMGMDGSQVQDMYDAGKIKEINDYCRQDVLDTYFVFLRSRVLQGSLTLEMEQRIVGESKAWLEHHADEDPAFQNYLKHWGDWIAPEE